jgi:predicted outer membrane repeat protein
VCEGQCPIRVDPKIAAAGDGKTWKTAFRSLQDAVDQQEEAGGGEVWVKTGSIAASGSDTLLTLKSGVDVYGGFAGNELARADRDTPTADRATTLNANEVSYPAVIGDGVEHVTFDGFAVKNAVGAKGSAFQATGSSDLTLSHVFFSDNSATGCGGAMWLENAEVRLVGGAFEDNHADGSGGAICTERATKLEVEGTRFIDNDAVQRGGAIDAYGTYSPEAKPDLAISAATFIGNRATRQDEPSSGGGALYQMAGTLTIVDSDFKANYASLQSGAAVYLSDVAADVYNSVFAENEGFRTAFHTDFAGPVHIVNCTFAFNDVNCPGPCSVSGDATVVENSLSVVTEKIQWPGFASGVTKTTNCDVFTSGGLGSIASPFGTAPLLDRDENGVEDYRLLVVPSEDSQPCFYQGNDAVSDAAGIEWKSLTTSGNNCLDVSPVDMGRHYEPTNANPTACE